MLFEKLALREVEGGVLLGVKVVPRSSRDCIAGVEQGFLKVKLHSPPVEGAANVAAGEFLAEVLGLPKGAVRMVGGAKSRKKTFHLRGTAPARILEALQNHV